MAKLKITKDSINVVVETPKERTLCMGIKGGMRLDSTEWMFPHSATGTLMSVFYNINSYVEAEDAAGRGVIHPVILKLLKKYDSKIEDVANLKKNGAVNDDGSFLFAHQQLCRQIALLEARYCFFLETGTGKTPLSLQVIADDKLQAWGKGEKHKWLVICPLSLINSAWVDDCHRFFPSLTIVNLHGNTTAQQRRAFATDADIYVINFESFVVRYEEICKLKIHGCIIDESSKLKNPNSGVTKQVLKFSRNVKRWYNLSGTPAPNSMLEYFAQMKTIDENLLGKSFTNFKARFFYTYTNGGGFAVHDITPESKEKLIKILEQKAIFIAKKDCLDLPEQMDIIREIEMSPAVKKIYKQMKDELWAEVGAKLSSTGSDKAIEASTTLVALMKLNQITSGILMDENSEIHYIHRQKVEMLIEVLEGIASEQAIIWANFRGEFNMIKEYLGCRCVTYYGGTDRSEIEPLMQKHYGVNAYQEHLDAGLTMRDMAVKLFKDGHVQYFVANPKSAAHGLTLTNASYAIYMSLNYSYEQWKQSRDRIHRYSQTSKCTYISILMKGTIDYVIYKVLQNKGELLDGVLHHLKPGAMGGDQ